MASDLNITKSNTVKRKLKRIVWTLGEKRKAVDFLKNHTLTETLNEFGCSKSNLYKWKDQEDNLAISTGKNKHLPGAGRPLKSDKLEKFAVRYVENLRNSKYSVSGIELQEEVKLCGEKYDLGLTGSDGWLEKFKVRNNYVFRDKTTAPQHVPFNNEAYSKAFLKFFNLSLICNNITSDEFIMNVDETSLAYDMPARRTLEKKGVKNVPIRSFGKEKNTVTAILAICANGDKLPPFVVLRGTHKSHQVPSKVNIPQGMYVVTQKKGHNDKEIMELWIDQLLIPWLNSKGNPKVLLLMDQVRIHCMDNVRSKLYSANVDVMYIPTGCTSFLQPLDVSANRSLKAKLRQKWNSYSRDASVKRTKSKKGFVIDHDSLLMRTMDSWNELTLDVILNGWRKPGFLPLNITKHDSNQ